MQKIKYSYIAVAWMFWLMFVGGCHKQVNDTRALEKNKTPGSTIQKLSIHVDGNKLRNERGEVVQLRGVNLMGMEYTAIGGWWPQDPFFTVVETTWPALHEWHVNSIRIPLNETSYLGIQCVKVFTGPAYNKPGEIQESDPGHNYRARLKEVVDRATKEGLYVILDLHMAAPNDPKNQVGDVAAQCATDANPLPDADHAIAFWTEIALAYGSYPNVMFELFNNPYIDQWRYFLGSKTEAWKALRDGAVINSYLPLWPTRKKHLWRSAGTQQMLDAIRATGATNVIMLGGLSHSADLESWVAFTANDSIKQITASWHAFSPKESKWGDRCYIHPGPWCDDRAYSFVAAILAQNYPVVVTEFGDLNSPGTVGAPFASTLLPKLDAMGISYLAWTFTASTMKTNQLIKDNLGTPTDGYGKYVKTHYSCDAGNQSGCKDESSLIQNHISEQQSSQSNPNSTGWTPSVSPI